ncbi:glutamate racemase [Diaphorobacter aerolatus]|uniref:Glutamate racemase n=1 Tax=Diaphorobacter aerolatus TaxID=1288495 RepID=A0A7H0GJ04_9BURK|nr:glutamate racemase [Diaphorobacter aerolatus]QNP48270.1 glutamate racemase [Diaphorobacter aerolatus]
MSSSAFLSSSSASPVGVFDSGIGGLSVLQELRSELPYENFVYLADSGNAPYGERGDEFVKQRTLAIARHLLDEHRIKALVVACNTATTAAVAQLREALPDLPVIGVEPALKPAASSSQTHRVGVIATRGTVQSARFEQLRQAFSDGTEFRAQACDGLVRAIERSVEEEDSEAASSPAAIEIRELCERYTAMLGSFGVRTGDIDTLVLGCTHYVFIKDELRKLLGPDVHIIDTGAPVARQTRRILVQRDTLAPEADDSAPSTVRRGTLQLYTTGRLGALQAAAKRWLQLPPEHCHALAA